MRTGPARRRQRGMLLPALIVLLAVGGLGWLLSRQDSAAHRDLIREARTADALATAREALLGYAATYRNREHANADFGYLPCPDLDGDGSSETCGTKGQTSIGRLPYLTLNLPDLRDGNGECLWYAVSGSFKNNPKPDALNSDSTGSFQLIDDAGATRPLAGDQSGRAAALVIAAGAPQAGQSRSAGPARCGGDSEARQLREYVEALEATDAKGITPVRTSAGNDRLMAITTDDIYRQLKRRPSYAGWLQQVIQASADCLASLPAAVAPERVGPVELGRLPALDKLTGTCRNETLRDAVANWAEAMRYARCADGTDCLAGIGRRCRGALIFGGERADASQRRVDPADRLVTRNYLEADTLAALATGQLGSLPTTFAITAPDRPASADIALCIP